MINITKTEVVGFEAACRGMRKPLNSEAKADSYYGCKEGGKCELCVLNPYINVNCDKPYSRFVMGPNDHKLAMYLSNAGANSHSKFKRFIAVYADILAPLYWWKEYDTYKVGTVANSRSTMHKIQAKEFTWMDFSTDHLIGEASEELDSSDILLETIIMLNYYREQFLKTGNKDYWWQMIQLLPTSYNQERTVMLNYQVLTDIYKDRHNHKLDEWHGFCDWIKTLPYSELIINDWQDVKIE